MNKLFNWCKDNILFIFTLFLLAFIPLYPKLPLVDVRNTWVYVRLEDFVIFFVILFWMLMVLRQKLTLKTPLTLQIFTFWLMGGIATLHGILLIFPETANVFPTVAFLSYLRRIEYMSLFFISYAAMKDKKFLTYVIIALTATLFAVIIYGIGQRYMGFPAFLTMNEEFAKGFAIRLSPLSRVSSTFGGHYDLAAYLVLVIPIIVSLFFAYKNWMVKTIFLITSVLGLFVLFMTVSRISLLALFVSVGIVLFFQRKKLVLFSIPIIAVIIVLAISLLPSLSSRFENTIKEVDILVDAATGDPIGEIKEVPNTYFKDKTIRQQFSRNMVNLEAYASASSALVIPYTYLPEKVELFAKPNAPTGENLPSGTAYINLSLSPITKRLGNFYFERKPDSRTGLIDVYIINGDYLIKKAAAYDLSFTTRFQGEWPHALEAFKRNIFLGSGYGSVSLAVDNSYLRALAEVGVLGFASFLAIFVAIGIYLKKTLSSVDSRPLKSFVFGLIAGIVGLAINGIFIDVFEASKIAFVFWLLTGISLGAVDLYHHISFDIFKELKNAATSTYAIILYLFIITVLLFSPLTRNFFVGDDFTWFRWAADCGNTATSPSVCPITLSNITRYFTHADGFFYRPGAKVYFLLMYRFFWLNQTIYHLVSIFLHFAVSVLVFLLARKIFKNLALASLSGFLFLSLSGYTEAVFWISATGFLFTSCFSLASLLSFISWNENKRKIYFGLTIIFFVLSLMFHELGIVTPLLYLLYLWFVSEQINLKSLWKNIYYRILFAPVLLYLLIRFLAGSHWLSGDYNYNLLKLPFNVLGNAIGYLVLVLIGPLSEPKYQAIRNILKDRVFLALLPMAVVSWLAALFYKRYWQKIKKSESKILLFALFFFIIALLPFLGLGNITSRYSYFSSVGAVFLLVFILHRVYMNLLVNGKSIAISLASAAVLVFCLLQVMELQQIHRDWYGAGEKSRRFFISIDSNYDENWTKDRMEFHLINVPIKEGQAWIFPVGIPDALWFVFRNPNLRVFFWPTVEQAFKNVEYNSKTQKVFVFDSDGNVQEVKRP